MLGFFLMVLDRMVKLEPHHRHQMLEIGGGYSIQAVI